MQCIPNSNSYSKFRVDPNPGMYYRVASRDIHIGYLLYFPKNIYQIHIDVHLIASHQTFLWHVVNHFLQAKQYCPHSQARLGNIAISSGNNSQY